MGRPGRGLPSAPLGIWLVRLGINHDQCKGRERSKGPPHRSPTGGQCPGLLERNQGLQMEAQVCTPHTHPTPRLLCKQSHLPRGRHSHGTSLNRPPRERVTHSLRGDNGVRQRTVAPSLPHLSGVGVPEGLPESPRGWLLGRESLKSSVGSQIRRRTEFSQLLVCGLFLINSSLAHAGSALSLRPALPTPRIFKSLTAFLVLNINHIVS